MQLSFAITVLYTQVTVHLRQLARPGLLWNDDDVAQGFAWNDGIVGFGMPNHDGECFLEVDTDSTAGPVIGDATLWAIAVPFEATSAQLLVGTVLDGRDCTIAPGIHQVTFAVEAGGDSYAYRCKLSFVKRDDPEFVILKQGSLQSGQVLHRRAPYA